MNYKYPLVKAFLIIPFGYLFNYIFDLNSFQFGIAVLLVLLVSILKISRIVKYISIFLLAGIYISFQHNYYSIQEFENKVSVSFEGVIDGTISKIISQNSEYVKVLTEVNIKSYALENDTRTNVVLSIYYSDKNDVIELKPGYDIKANVTLRTANLKSLPQDFNESNYLKSQSAHFYASCNESNFSFIERYKIITYLYDFKDNIKLKIGSHLKERPYVGILIALATGDKSDISYQTRKVFSKTGTAHVLAISGLHVGLIASFFYILTGFIRKKTLKLVIFLSLVWIFILVTGASASGIRAGFMISMFFILKYFNRVPNIINIVLFTLLVSILINPMLLFSISFQLSYSAILGIIILYNYIYNNLKSIFGQYNSKIIRYLCASIAISFAATIPTALLTAYYFNVFSIVYPLSNIFIIPLVSLATAFNFIYILFDFLYIPFADLYLNAGYILIELSVDINSYLLNFDLNLGDRGVNLVLLAFISSLILIFIFTAEKRNKFFLRGIIGVFSISLLLFSDILDENPNSIEVIPREQFVAVIQNTHQLKTVLVVDRMKYDYIKNDYNFINYILKDSISINLLKTSDASINIHDQIKKYDFVESQFVNKEFVDSVSMTLNILPLYKITDNRYGHN